MKTNRFLLILPVLLAMLSPLFLAPEVASACGGFVSRSGSNVKPESLKAAIIYNPTQDAGHEQLIVELRYLINQGSPTEFGWIMPVPTKPTVQAAPTDFFSKLGVATQPKQNYLEQVGNFRNGCKPLEAVFRNTGQVFSAVTKGGGGFSSVNVVSQQKIGQYELSVLAATDPQGLQDWAIQNGYATKSIDTKAIADYIDAKWYFVLAKLTVSAQAMREASTSLSTQFYSTQAVLLDFASPSIIYPWRLAAYNQLGEVATNRMLPVSLYVFYPGSRPVPTNEALLTYSYGEKLNKLQLEDLLDKIPNGNKAANFLSYYQSPSIAGSLVAPTDLVLKPTDNSKEFHSGKMDTGETLQAIGLSMAYPLLSLVFYIWPLLVLGLVSFRLWYKVQAFIVPSFEWSRLALWVIGLAWVVFLYDSLSCAMPTALFATEFLALCGFLGVWVNFRSYSKFAKFKR